MSSLQLENTYADLPERFYAPASPSPVAAPLLIRLNTSLAEELGLDPAELASEDGVAMLAGNRYPQGNRPIAQAYAGHQFGNFVPQLGDGRALLIGEVVDKQGVRRDIHLKGSGPTRFSRNGDGRAALGPVLREYIVSEAMHALGIPTTRTLAALSTGELVYRETRLPGAVMARVAASHIRIGTFQYFAAREDDEALRTLADYAIARHYPQIADSQDRYLALFDAVVGVQASLVAQWMLVGFIHGVMNTDNVTISGETIDYGPCAFMDAYHPSTVFSSIDHAGRYAYVNQPRIAVWNLARLAEALLPIIGDGADGALDDVRKVLGSYQGRYEAVFHSGLRRKLGLFTERDEDLALAADLFEAMAANSADFTLTFRALANELDPQPSGARARDHFIDPTAFDAWAERWRARLALEPEHDGERAQALRATNPKYIARNHRVEEAIKAAEQGDFTPFETLVKVLEQPFADQPEMERYAQPPADEERVLQTFCGT